jgi:hypothetical protein
LPFASSKELDKIGAFRMKSLCALLLVSGLALSTQAAVLLDDDWDDADRTDTNLPDESAWFGNTVAGGPTLSAATNALTALVRVDANVSSRLWITHFTPAGSPATLNLGDTLKLTLSFVPRNVTLSSTTSRGLRIGLFNFSEPGAARVIADGFSTGAGAGAPGTNVTGYMLNMNFAQTNTINSPLEIMKRTDMTTNNLMGTTAAFQRVGATGGGSVGNPGFSNDVPYTFEFSIRRMTEGSQITTTFADTNGWSMTHSVTDLFDPTFRFDGLAIRPNGVVDTADAFVFTRLKVETIPYELRIRSARFKTPQVLELQWESLPGKRYEVHWRAGLEPNQSWSLLGAAVDSQGTTTSFDDGDVPFEIQRFYRVFEQP